MTTTTTQLLAEIEARGAAVDAAIQQVVDRLLADHSGEVPRTRVTLGRGDVPAREVAAARVQNLALRHGELHRLPNLVPRGVPVDVVELVEVNRVGLQAHQAGIQGPAGYSTPRASPAVGPRRHRSVELGGQYSPLAASAPRSRAAGRTVAGRAGRTL